MIRASVVASILLASTTASAWPWPGPAPEPDAEPAPDPDPAPQQEPPKLEEPKPEPPPKTVTREELEETIHVLEARLKILEDKQPTNNDTRQKVESLGWLTNYINAFIDVGAFAVAGGGAGIRSDFQHTHYPQYANSTFGRWVFMGDPFTTSVNTLGEPAETGDSREVEVDTLNSQGRPTLLVNSIGLTIAKWVTDEVGISTLFQFLPRPGPDQTEISSAFIQYKPFHEKLLLFEAGKIDSVLGVEYRHQDATNRLEITPSLIARYTCGRPLGISGRFIQDFDAGGLSASAAILSGDNFEERFEPDTEIRSNKVPTMAGHLQWQFPVAQGLEIGISGAFGPQDNQKSSKIHQWHYGFDVKLKDLHGWDVIAEYVKGRQPGRTSFAQLDPMSTIENAPCDVADCLRYRGAYVLVDKRLNERVTPYVRFDWRDATHRHGDPINPFVYEANSIRGTFGVNVKATAHVHAKLEYISNRELHVPNFPHDVITSSVVVTTD